ncbi:thioredoxin-dependent thiol peroxidase [Candidatus Paracaedibacter symbiosus]|uniref:thioredoxin-dependent thiol peroxidase n=1 Tax=Candidatus Paracaedibacter symbiosus TaxID=244582 RepID=UPI000509CF5F|nr:thioredoxin-dependent thiol peroxidase [Candidatus Paracaedibacter symbiosus]
MKLEVGANAPEFTLPSDTETTVSLKNFRGKNLIIYFYPKDDTSGCTAEACQFRDMLPNFAGINAAVLGISRDSVKSHQKFRDKYELTFPLLSDESGEVCQSYGVWVEKSMYGRKYFGIERTTFLIDATGVIQKIWSKVKVPGHADAILKAIGSQ